VVFSLANKMKIYMDSCCFNRPFDDLSQAKIRLEREAVLSIVGSCEVGIWDIFQSDVLEDEINRILNPFKKKMVSALYSSATINIELNNEIISRAAELINTFGIEDFDALHLASAEYGEASILLTTDKKFINRALKSNTKIRAVNPVAWLTEVLLND